MFGFEKNNNTEITFNRDKTIKIVRYLHAHTICKMMCNTNEHDSMRREKKHMYPNSK